MNAIHGDSTTWDPWVKALQGDRAHLLLTDPPYCLLTRRRKSGERRDPKKVKNEGPEVRRFESVSEYREFTKAWMAHAQACTLPEAPWIIWTNLLGKAPILAEAQAHGRPNCWGEFTWAKRTREGNSGEELLRVVEVALVLSPVPMPALAAAAPARPWAVVAGYDDDGEATTWGSHPNHKPFGVLEALVRTYSQPGQLIVDCFAGSGSIPAAAARLERRAAAIEKSAEWAKRVKARLAATSFRISVT